MAAIIAGLALSAKLAAWVTVILVVLGGIEVITAAIAWCPMKFAFGQGKSYSQK